MECDWCPEETDGRNEVVIAGVGRFKVCNTCLNLYGNQAFDELTKRVEKKVG